MKRNSILVLVIIVVTLIIVFYSSVGGLSPEDYRAGILKEREEKDIYMRNSEGSPFTRSTETYEGLKYFEPDLNYRVTAKLEFIEDPKTIELLTSDDKQNSYKTYAYAKFELNNATCQLLILEITDKAYAGELFLAFADATSAYETYGAGRYLDLEKVKHATSIVLDFNKAYNPYCAYNDTYSCPFPPRENILDIPIRAGEKTYH